MSLRAAKCKAVPCCFDLGGGGVGRGETTQPGTTVGGKPNNNNISRPFGSRKKATGFFYTSPNGNWNCVGLTGDCILLGPEYLAAS